jgi:hypothetical protein
MGAAPKLKAAWLELAEETVAGLSSTSLGQVSDLLADLAANLTRAAASLVDVPHYVAPAKHS